MGRPKGSPNKFGTQARENVVAVFTRLGGTAAMAKWAIRNKTEFYKLYARLIPTHSTLTVNPINVTDLTDGELLLIATGRSAGAVSEETGENESHELH